MTTPELTLDGLLAEALSLSAEDINRFRVWDGTAWPAARAEAIASVMHVARREGRAEQQLTAMDDAYHSVATAAGENVPWTWTMFGDDRSKAEPWQPAARLAAEVAAAIVVRDLIDPATFEFLLEPWQRLRGQRYPD